MKRLILLILPFILFAGCAEYNISKKYKQYSGINYRSYEIPSTYTELDLATDEEEETEEPVEENNIEIPEVIEITEEEIIESSNQAYGEAVVVMASKKIPLSKNATGEDLMTFQTALDKSYNAILKSYRTQGFTYTLAPAGTVNPLSVINVQCLLSENFANTSGKKVCDAFFAQIPIEYENVKAEKAEQNVKNL